jgi:hypothetical protein
VNTRYTLIMEQTREDGGETFVEHAFEAENLNDILQEMTYFLWHAGFSYLPELSYRPEPPCDASSST